VATTLTGRCLTAFDLGMNRALVVQRLDRAL